MTNRILTAGLAAAVGLALAGMLYSFSIAPLPEPAALNAGVLEFQGPRALETTTTFVTSFPDRSATSLGRSDAAQWLVDQFISLGYDPQVESFSAWVGQSSQPNLTNIWAVKQGETADTIAVYAHYDTPSFVTQGAADDGSGVGAVLELARILAPIPTHKTILFICFDGSEYGSAGARAFLGRGTYGNPIVAAIGLDFLNTGTMAGISVECHGSGKGYTPPWLRNLAYRAAEKFTTPSTVDTVSEWAERSVAVSPTDVGVFLQRHIPAVNLAGIPADVGAERAAYHSANDLVDNLDVTAFAKWGQTAELMIRTIDAMETMPRGAAASSVYLGLAGGQYARGWAVRTFQFLIFSPLWVTVGYGWYRRRRALGAAAVILRDEARRIFATVGCLFVGYLVLKVSPLVGLFQRYPIYPATPKDPYLFRPTAIPIILALAAAGGALYLVGRRTTWFRPPLGADWSERYHAMLTILAAAVLLTWFEGAGYAAVSFLAAPVYLWFFISEPVGSRRAKWVSRVVNGLLVLAGTIPFWVAGAVLREAMMAGPAWWYFALAAAYGLVGLKPVVVFLSMAALHDEAFVLGTGLGTGTIPTEMSSDTRPARPIGGGMRAGVGQRA